CLGAAISASSASGQGHAFLSSFTASMLIWSCGTEGDASRSKHLQGGIEELSPRPVEYRVLYHEPDRLVCNLLLMSARQLEKNSQHFLIEPRRALCIANASARTGSSPQLPQRPSGGSAAEGKDSSSGDCRRRMDCMPG